MFKNNCDDDFLKCKFDVEKNIPIRIDDYVTLEKNTYISMKNKVELGQLSEGLIHDLSTPLSALSLHIERLSNKGIDTCKIEKITNVINDFVFNIRSVIGKENRTYNNYRCNIIESLQVMKEIFDYKLKVENIDLTIDCMNDISLPTHHVRINQLFMNLISNAIESFDKEQDGKKVSIAVLVSEYSKVKIIIQDNGCGIDGININSILKSPFTTKLHGTGTGLMHVAEIVKNDLSGDIIVKSKINIGTQIVITIPK